jgi:hypothetical protein
VGAVKTEVGSVRAELAEIRKAMAITMQEVDGTLRRASQISSTPKRRCWEVFA